MLVGGSHLPGDPWELPWRRRLKGVCSCSRALGMARCLVSGEGKSLPPLTAMGKSRSL